VGELVHVGPSLGYRVSSKRVVFGRRGALELGSWSRGTHEGATMDGCLVDHPLLVEAARELARAADAMGIAPFDETRGQGDLRYVWLKTDGARVLVTLVTASEDSEAARSLPQRLSLAHGVAWSVQPAKGNAMRGSAPRVLVGAPSLSVSMAGVPLEVGPLGFLQPNPAVIERAYLDLVRDEAGEATAGELAWDLYAGAGVTAALLARSFARVLACESYPESAAALGVEPCSVERFLDRESGTPALVVANPPRKGLGADVCEALARIAPPRLHVMSCGPEGLARDLAQLVRSGYRLASLTAYDTLPQTPHVELVARLIGDARLTF
jgi:23S rRNA (uracil1939-C5)-methyltransferase